MRRLFLIILFITIACQAVFSQEKTAVDYRADFTKLIKMGDSSVVKLLGNVFLFHNGAVISCDSAYRYSEKKIEALGRVIINQNSLYIYGDKVLYNGESEQAEVFSPLIKIVDSGAVMYTRYLTFNTGKKIGHFYGGATLRNNQSVMEAQEGYYNTETKIFDLEKDVEMENEEYILKTQNLTYDQNKENIFFNTLANIWNKKGEYLQADKGNYEKLPQIYNFEKNSYILTKEQEVWSDSLKYYSTRNEVELKRNIQMIDTTQKVVSFGDYGFFWSDSKNVLLTKNPSLFSYGDQNADTTFMRADTMTVKPIIDRNNIKEFFALQDSIRNSPDSSKLQISELDIHDKLVDSLSRNLTPQQQELLKKAEKNPGSAAIVDKITAPKDSVVSKKELKEIEKEEKEIEKKGKEIEKVEKEQTKTTEQDSTKQLIDDLYVYTPAFTQQQLNEMNENDRKEAESIMRRDLKSHERTLRQLKRKKRVLEIIEQERASQDSIKKSQDTTIVEENKDTPEIIEVKNQPDTSDYIVRGFGNSKIFKRDMQSIADTLIVETVDSTQTSIGTPYAWNGLNQIQAKRIRTYTKDGGIFRTRMFDNPILSQQVKPNKYNQIGGSYIDALYRNNEIYRLIVTKNATNRFYREEKIPDTVNDMEPVAFITSTSENMVIDMDSSVITRIKWIGATETYTYPIEQEPEDKLYLEGLKWVPELRPVRSDVFDRVVRPSVREEREAIAKPKFLLTTTIIKERDNLLRSGSWFDRNEKLNIDINELFRQSTERHD